MTRPPVILDLDGSAGHIDGAVRLDLAAWQEAVRFGCGMGTFRALRAELARRLPARHGTVLLGSGDFHHLSWPLVERCAATEPLQLVVFDNHPDNMRFPFGIHCGSWVRRAALLPRVAHVHVVGITSGDIGLAHSWENYLAPLRAGKLSYWCMDVDPGWLRWVGASAAARRFDAPDVLIDALLDVLAASAEQVYLSIDKDAFAPEVVRTNWDQGRMGERHVLRVIDALAGRLAGSDITGDVSAHTYRTRWKRWLSAADGQAPVAPEVLAGWQGAQREFNGRLLAAIRAAGG